MYFVSYSWIEEKPDKRVLQLVAKLRESGYQAECDVMKIQKYASINFVEMMAKSLQEAEKVIIVLSEAYKKRRILLLVALDRNIHILSVICSKSQKNIYWCHLIEI